jgi:hypothetical protein
MALAVIAAKLALGQKAMAAVQAPLATPEELTAQENLRRLYLAYIQANGHNAKRYEINMSILKAAYTLHKQDGFSKAQIEYITKQAKQQAQRDFQSGSLVVN